MESQRRQQISSSVILFGVNGLRHISISGDLEGEYVVLPHSAGRVLRIAPIPPDGLPKVTSLRKTCIACPAQWEGTLNDGRALYARFRWGRLTVGLGENADKAIDNSMSEEALFCEQVGYDLDGFMTFEELRANLLGLLDFPAGLDIEPERGLFEA